MDLTTSDVLMIVTFMNLLGVFVCLALLLRASRLSGPGGPPFDPAVVQRVGDAVARAEEVILRDNRENRKENQQTAGQFRAEVQAQIEKLTRTNSERLDEQSKAQREQLNAFETMLKERLQDGAKAQETLAETLREKQDVLRTMIDGKLQEISELNGRRLEEIRKNVSSQLEEYLQRFGATISQRLQEQSEGQDKLTKTMESQQQGLRDKLDEKLKELRDDNSKRLEEMRKTVDEKLQSTLEKRLGESFSQVSDRLEQVHKGLGEMQTLAGSVGDLKRTLTNVKTRGGVGRDPAWAYP